MNHRFTRAATAGAISAILALTLAACAVPTTESAPEQSPVETPETAVEPNAFDVMFVGMMIPHHEEAVEMSDLLLAKEGVEAEVVELAEAIKAAQEPEIEQMQAWLDEWDSMPAEGMEGMDHGDEGGAVMSDADMDALADASGPAAGDLFLELMIVHHEGAIEMAQDELGDGQHPDVLELARAIVDSQSAEIELMREMLAS